MGEGCSSALADIYLHHKGISILYEVMYFRYVDDILICFKEADYTVCLNCYPKNLTLVETAPNIDGSLNFRDISISLSSNNDNNRFVKYRLYDKRDDYLFITHRIFSWNTRIHKNIKRNVILNYLQRCKILNTCTGIMDSNIRGYMYGALKKGFPFKFLLIIIRNFFNINKIKCVNCFFKFNYCDGK